ncbi:MAG: amidohydrolase [Desulfobacteraceae bacterium]|jgi:5-methylthioadenosine/S-adenosylhomocysteine deaminase
MARPNPNQNPSQVVSNSEPDIIIEGGVLITMVDGQAPLDPARIWVRGDRISHIEKADNKSEYHGNAEIIDARNCIIMPGLVNAHSHTAMTLFRGLADDLPLKEWLFDKIFPAESKHLRPETVYWGSLLGCLEMIASGTTTVIDGYFFQDDTVRAIHESGLRGLIAQGVIDCPAPGVPNPKDNLTVGEEYIKRWLGYSDLINPGIFCHSPLTCSDKTLKRAMEISRDFSLPLQIHLAETSEEVSDIVNRTGKRPVHYLDVLGLLDEGLIAAHAIHLSDDEMKCLAERGVKIVHVPESNMKLSSGVARVSEMVRLGLTVGLGTDGCASNNNLDMFQEMDSAAKLGKVSTLDPVNMDATTVLKMVTSWGASLLGLEKEIGTIEVDKKADIIVVDLNSPHSVPLYNPLSTIVYSASGADVRDVIVNGRILMKDRTFLTLDPDEIMDRVTAFGREIAG